MSVKFSREAALNLYEEWSVSCNFALADEWHRRQGAPVPAWARAWVRLACAVETARHRLGWLTSRERDRVGRYHTYLDYRDLTYCCGASPVQVDYDAHVCPVCGRDAYGEHFEDAEVRAAEERAGWVM